MFLTVWKYIFTIFALGYGVYTAYEDLKTKEIHATPVAINAAIGFAPHHQFRNNKHQYVNVIQHFLTYEQFLSYSID